MPSYYRTHKHTPTRQNRFFRIPNLGYNGKCRPYNLRAIHPALLVDEPHEETGIKEGSTGNGSFTMDTTYRFRFLIYLAAFMLVMSLCFVYAEPVPSQNHLLFQVAPQHAGFLAPSNAEPSFDPAALHAATPVISPEILRQLGERSHAHHGLFHRAQQKIARPVPAGGQSESSVLGLTIQPSVAASSTR